nr:PREDICTED: uncharacterized protein LOC109030468 [Bemisia tabaci]
MDAKKSKKGKRSSAVSGRKNKAAPITTRDFPNIRSFPRVPLQPLHEVYRKQARFYYSLIATYEATLKLSEEAIAQAKAKGDECTMKADEAEQKYLARTTKEIVQTTN